MGPEHGIYKLEMRLYADLTGSMPLISPEENELSIDELLERLADVDPSLVEEDVHQELSFTLCKRCKERFAANPLCIPLDAN